MLRSYLYTALRNLIRNRIYATINIIGLAIGIACCFLILLHVQREFSFDKFHEKHDRIYRVFEEWHRPGGYSWTRSITGSAAAPRLIQDFPQVESVVRYHQIRRLVSKGDKNIFEDDVFYADEDFFRMFSFDFLSGSPEAALTRPGSIVLTSSVAAKYFGGEEPVGQTLTLDGAEMTVTGVISQIPSNTHLRFDILASFSSLTASNGEWNDNWQCATRTYILLKDGVSTETVEAGLPAFVKKYHDEETASKLTYGLQPLDDIHLHPTTVDLEAISSEDDLILLSLIGGFILLLAIVNFVNLSSALFMRRAGEVGVRKVLGAGRGQIRWQFIGESLVIASAAALLSVPLAELFLPVFNALSGAELDISYLGSPVVPAAFLFTIALVGIGGGFYPAFLLSRLKPIEVANLSHGWGVAGLYVRRGLVVFQFAVSAALILSSIIVFDQSQYLVEKDIGFTTKNLVVVPVDRDWAWQGRLGALKNEIAKQPGVLSVAASSNFPCDGQAYGIDILPSGASERVTMVKIYADEDYVRTLGLNISSGRNFLSGREGERHSGLIVNESAGRCYEEFMTVGSNVRVFDGVAPEGFAAEVVGVVEDFHFRDLSNRLQPAVILVEPSRARYLLVRLADDKVAAAVASIGEVFSQFAPNRPFEYSFLDDELSQIYRAERVRASQFGYSCLLAIFVAMIGLFGLVLYITEQRTKEIGIRKVFGASSANIVRLLVAEFGVLVVVANGLALPVAFYFLRDWLNQYPYRISWSPWHFLAVVLASLLLAFATVGYRSYRSAVANPIDAIRYE